VNEKNNMEEYLNKFTEIIKIYKSTTSISSLFFVYKIKVNN